MIQNDQGSDSMIRNFETTVSCLLPYDPVSKSKSAGHKRNHASISEMLDQLEVASTLATPKPSIE